MGFINQFGDEYLEETPSKTLFVTCSKLLTEKKYCTLGQE